MKIRENELLNKYTTIKIGGIAKKMYIPESESDLIELVRNHSVKYILGGGSNLLINNRCFEEVVNLRELDSSILDMGNGRFQVGASVRLQELILTINQKGYGGIEYLFSVPGLVGGAIVMNAGGGIEQGWSISDHIVSIKVLHNGKVSVMSKEECYFTHRNSIFKKIKDIIVMSAVFQFEKGTPKELENKRRDRIDYCRMNQDIDKPNFGSVFSISNGYIMALARRYSLGNKKKIHFSNKTGNWIINEGEGTFKEAYALIKRVHFAHIIVGRKCVTEVVVWK